MPEVTPGEYLSFVHYCERGDKTDADRRLDHAALGLTSEAGELADLSKKALVSGEPTDQIKAFDECGDALFYIGIVMNVTGRSFEDLMRWNMAKLRRRNVHGKDKVAERAMLEEFLK